MKGTRLFQLFLAALISLTLVACDTRQDRDDTVDNRGTDTYTPDTRDNTGTELGTDAERDHIFFDDDQEYTYENRNQFRQDVQNARNRLDQEITRLESQVQGVPSDDRKDIQEKMNDLKEKRDELDKEMKAFDRSNDDNWEDFRGKVETAWSDVEDSYKDVRDEIRNSTEDQIDNTNKDMNRDGTIDGSTKK